MFMFKKTQEVSASELHKKCLASTAIAQQKVERLAPYIDAPNTDPLEGTAYDFRRDFVGYGREPPNPKWPKNARIAVCFVINYEEGAEKGVQNGDFEAESRLWEQSDNEPRIGQRDLQVESDYEYGSRVGIWRLLNMFEERKIRVTASCCGQALEKNRQVAKALVQGDHEVSSHCYRFIDYHSMEPELERDYIRRQIKSIKEQTGRNPSGWHYGRLSPKSKGLLHQVLRDENVDLLYCSDAYNDDLPYWVDVPAEEKVEEKDRRGMLMLPFSYDCNDLRFCLDAGSFGGAHDFSDYLRRTFDTLMREGQNGRPKMMSIGLHARISGKPGRFSAVREFADYISKQEGVWVTTRREVAKHFREQFPYDRRRGGRGDRDRDRDGRHGHGRVEVDVRDAGEASKA